MIGNCRLRVNIVLSRIIYKFKENQQVLQLAPSCALWRKSDGPYLNKYQELLNNQSTKEAEWTAQMVARPFPVNVPCDEVYIVAHVLILLSYLLFIQDGQDEKSWLMPVLN